MRYLIFIFLLAPVLVQAQSAKASKMSGKNRQDLLAFNGNGTVVKANVHNGDTIPMINLPEVKIASERVWTSYADQMKWDRLKRKVKKVYPYAQLARLKMEKLELELDTLDKRKDQRKYIKAAEKELFSEFEDDIKDMTVSEGIILIKLIDRETGDSSFELVKQLKGSFNAFMWQSVARVFGHNLKTKYDPNGEDYMIEQIVLLIKKGDI